VTALVFVLDHRGSYLVEKASQSGRWWRGLSLFPLVEIGQASGGAIAGSSRVFSSDAKASNKVSDVVALRAEIATKVLARAGIALRGEPVLAEPIGHSVTRYNLELVPVFGSLTGPRPKLSESGEWVKEADLAGLSWPGPFGRLVRKLTAG
jgi:hypothetical protein